jgi:eukaryotic-like serine/threonine-protein kinase
MPTAGPKKLGKYEVLEVVGHGGMGVVYKAVDHEIGRLVGIKMMTKAVMNDPVLLQRFYREAQSAGKLRHPNIVTIYDLGIQEDVPYIVMEFLEGESLDVAFRSGRPLTLGEKLNIVVQVCSALAYAHEQSIIHRDIKPGNVMLLKDGTVKLVDFGIARIGAEYVTRAGQLLGSIQYMSPEQINGAHVDLRTDIFSTGVLLYQMLTNTLPFEAQDAGATLLRIIHGSPPPLSKFLQDYPPELDGILQRVLAKTPEDRYQTANELAFDLCHVEERLIRKWASEQLDVVQSSLASGQWDKAREQLLQLLKVDRQNTRANVMLREVQQQIHKQQRFQRIKDLQVQAEEAADRNALEEALRYLDIAVNLDESNFQLRELRDSIGAKKERADRVKELLAHAKSAFDTQDLEDALASAQQALSVDAENPQAKELHAAIAHELAARAKWKQVQNCLDEARKQISARHFTAALDVLQEAESIDPQAPGVNELLALASAGQQQERRRKEVEQLSADIEEALNRNDFVVACAKAGEAVEKFPNDRGLCKLQALANKEREAAEKRMYVEGQVALARRLLEEKKSAEALAPLQEALLRYPEEFVLQSMHSLIKEYIERDRAEQFKTNVIKQAKEALRHRAYGQAIEILQAAQRQTRSGEFDDLLQFAQEEAANFATRQKVDAAAQKSHQLMSADQYEQAVELLEATLKEVDDQELHIILEGARRHIEEFNAHVKEAIATARRLVSVQRYNEAVKFLDSHLARFGKISEFSRLADQVRQEQRRTQAFSLAKEEARELLANSDFEAARAVLGKYCEEFGSDVDTHLLHQEISAKESAAAVTKMAQALKDCRVLLLVGCYQAALDILKRVSCFLTLVPGDMRQDYDFAHASAITGVNTRRLSNERFKRLQQRAAQIGNDPTLSESQWETAGPLALNNDPVLETRVSSVAELESVLGEVTLVAEHYPGDQKILSAVGTVRQQLTIQIAALKRGDDLREAGQSKPAPIAGLEAKVEDSAKTADVQKTAKDKKARPIPWQQSVRSPAPVATVRRKQTAASSSNPSIDIRAASETELFPLGRETAVAPVQGSATAVGSDQQTLHTLPPSREKSTGWSKWLKHAPAALLGVALLALILYMAWRLTHRITPGPPMKINRSPKVAAVPIRPQLLRERQNGR